jgi:hypothetical protein
VGGFVRSAPFHNISPELLIVQFEMELLISDKSSANGTAAFFYVGENYTSENNFQAPSDNNTFAKISINVLGNGNYRLGGPTGNVGGPAISGWSKVFIAINNSGRTLSYKDADSTQHSLNSKSYDVWVFEGKKGTRYLQNQSRLSNNQNLELKNFAFHFNYADATIRFRNARILPVNLMSFNAQPMGDKVELAWQTAWERNSKEFVVQRSSDLKEFGDLATLPAAGDAQSRNSYAYTDHSPLPGTNYYRLRMVDVDGSYEYSKVIDAQLRPDQPLVLVSPNPATAQLIRLRAFNTDASSLRLTNLLGQEVPFRTHSSGGEVLELLPLQPLTPGLYLLTLQQEGLRQHTKVLVR